MGERRPGGDQVAAEEARAGEQMKTREPASCDGGRADEVDDEGGALYEGAIGRQVRKAAGGD